MFGCRFNKTILEQRLFYFEDKKSILFCLTSFKKINDYWPDSISTRAKSEGTITEDFGIKGTKTSSRIWRGNQELWFAWSHETSTSHVLEPEYTVDYPGQITGCHIPQYWDKHSTSDKYVRRIFVSKYWWRKNGLYFILENEHSRNSKASFSKYDGWFISTKFYWHPISG